MPESPLRPNHLPSNLSPNPKSVPPESSPIDISWPAEAACDMNGYEVEGHSWAVTLLPAAAEKETSDWHPRSRRRAAGWYTPHSPGLTELGRGTAPGTGMWLQCLFSIRSPTPTLPRRPSHADIGCF